MLHNAIRVMTTLYIVATPIGNLEDITYRAVHILGSVAIIAAEDTRRIRKILNHYSITPPRLISCRAQNEKESANGIVKLLNEGKDVAFVSDAGTPGISDPGSRLVNVVRREGHRIVPIPGVSATTALISVSGIAGKGFLFEGFLSPKAGRRRSRLTELIEMDMVFILYESPHRIYRLLQDIAELAPIRQVLIGREVTKKFEEILSGTALELLAILGSRSIIKGEITVIVG